MPSLTQISPPQRRSRLSLVPPVSLLPCRRRGDAAPQVRTHLSDLSVLLSVRQPDLLSVCELQITQAPRLSRALGSVLPLRTSVMTAQAQMNLSPPLCPPARHPLPSLRRNDTVSEQGENSMTGKSIQLPLSTASLTCLSHLSLIRLSLFCVSHLSLTCLSAVHEYLQFCSSYSDQSPLMFYQRPPGFSQRYNSRHRELDTSYQLSHAHLDTQLDADLTPSPELVPAPILPPKKKQQVSEV